MKEDWLNLGGLISLLGFIPYIVAICRDDKLRPSRATWYIWAFINLVITASLWKGGGLTRLTMASLVGTLVTALIVARRGKPGWSKLEKLSFLGALGSMLGWAISREPEVALWLSLVASTLGGWPTLSKVWHDPISEPRLSWAMSVAACSCTLLGLARYTSMTMAQPIVYMSINAAILGVLLSRSWWLKRLAYKQSLLAA